MIGSAQGNERTEQKQRSGQVLRLMVGTPQDSSSVPGQGRKGELLKQDGEIEGLPVSMACGQRL